MELELLRDYFPQGTNGDLLHNGKIICFTIELPWKNNEKKISCIPEGKYSVILRCNKEFGWHLLIEGVQDREGILMHPANVAVTELKGCIAPVSKLTSEGCGSGSRNALKRVVAEIFGADEHETIFLTIKKK